ncbi:unnamed protein product [Polarella glacialis]|uniref:Starch synthase catalytic domain-containing protein n=1 Tax=Polarella glacialis TaxID=89957 RepID=A0A813KWZ0_POLGL|nr:unnamed protein product [Polarella glacialis]
MRLRLLRDRAELQRSAQALRAKDEELTRRERSSASWREQKLQWERDASDLRGKLASCEDKQRREGLELKGRLAASEAQREREYQVYEREVALLTQAADEARLEDRDGLLRELTEVRQELGLREQDAELQRQRVDFTACLEEAGQAAGQARERLGAAAVSRAELDGSVLLGGGGGGSSASRQRRMKASSGISAGNGTAESLPDEATVRMSGNWNRSLPAAAGLPAAPSSAGAPPAAGSSASIGFGGAAAAALEKMRALEEQLQVWQKPSSQLCPHPPSNSCELPAAQSGKGPGDQALPVANSSWRGSLSHPAMYEGGPLDVEALDNSRLSEAWPGHLHRGEVTSLPQEGTSFSGFRAPAPSGGRSGCLEDSGVAVANRAAKDPTPATKASAAALAAPGAPAPEVRAAPSASKGPSAAPTAAGAKKESGSSSETTLVGKAAALVAGAPKASASGTPAAAAPKAASAGAGRGTPKTAASVHFVSPASAAAVVEESRETLSAVQRIALTGSAVARGTGAKAEPPAQPKAKATAAPPAAASAPQVRARAPDQSPPLAASAAVLGIVSGKPAPAVGGGMTTNGYPGATATVGPARTFAATAAPLIPAPTAKAADGSLLEVPQKGPAAVAVGRAIAAGLTPALQLGSGKARAPISKKFQVCFITSEVAPFSKTGGLGEAMDGLPTAMAALGHRVMVIAPRYDQYQDAWDTGYWSTVPMGGKDEPVHFFHCFKQKVDLVFVDHPTFGERVDGLSGSKLYGPEWGKDFADNQARFAYFCKAALKAIQELQLGGFAYGDECVVVANDWHSALVPMFIHAEKSANPSKWAATKTTFLCHNAVFQGRFQREDGLAEILGVPEHYVESITFKMPLQVGKYNEKIQCVNTMAAGLRYADRVLTVSPTYARECSTDPDKGVELEDLFALGKVTGILNGVKEGVSPADQNFVTKTMMTCGTFTAATAAFAKDMLKASYRAQNNLPSIHGPLMCFIGRLDAQKGYDLLLEALIDVLEDTEMQIVIVGAGRADLVAQTRATRICLKLFYI